MEPKIEIPKRRYTKPVIEMVDELKPVEDLPQEDISWISKLWASFNGWKRTLGIIMSGVGYVVTIWHPAGWGFVILGGVLGGTGVIHDLYKKSDGKIDWKKLFSKENIEKILKALIELIRKIFRR